MARHASVGQKDSASSLIQCIQCHVAVHAFAPFEYDCVHLFLGQLVRTLFTDDHQGTRISVCNSVYGSPHKRKHCPQESSPLHSLTLSFCILTNVGECGRDQLTTNCNCDFVASSQSTSASWTRYHKCTNGIPLPTATRGSPLSIYSAAAF